MFETQESLKILQERDNLDQVQGTNKGYCGRNMVNKMGEGNKEKEREGCGPASIGPVSHG